MRPYRLGLVLGRFQGLHIGHEAIIRRALAVCDRVIVMIGSADTTNNMRRITAAIITKQNAVVKILLASSLCFAPKRLATSAETDTLTAKKRESPMNLGWVVSATAATA